MSTPTNLADFPVLFEIPTLGWKVIDTLQGPCFRFPDGRHDWPSPRERQIIDAYRNQPVTNSSPVGDTAEWRYESGAIYSSKGRIILADRENPQTRPYERDDILKQVVREHALAVLVPELVAALKGIAVMFNTELATYDGEPWTQRVRAALARVEALR